jgi:4-amino-4-deoxy-L-arabinose transferase-like glycosyltransferase
MYRGIAILLLAVVLSVNVYRASTQSITSDEAFAQSLFLTGSWTHLFDSFDACHHVLHTILCKLSVSLFGLSEFTLRIPSLLGGLLYLVTVFRLSRRVFGEGRLFLLSAALLTLNPLMLDYMSAARGYGLALGLFLWAMYQMLLYAGEDADRRLIFKTGLGLGLAVAANLTLLVPGTALAVIFLAVLVSDRRTSEAIDSFVVPGIVTSFVIVVLPLTKAHRDSFYVGQPSLGDTLRTLLAPSLFHLPVDRRVLDFLPPYGFWFSLFTYVLVPLVLLATSLACIVLVRQWMLRRAFLRLDAEARFLLLCGGALLGSIGLLIGLHLTLQVLYPHERTGLYLIPLFVLTALALPLVLRRRRAAFLAAGLPVWLVGLACLVQFLAQFQATHYSEWYYEGSTKKIVGLIRERHAGQPAGRVRVGVTWELEPGMNFYRRMYKLDWMEPPTRNGADGDFDYYVLTARDTPLIKKRGLSVIFSDHVSGTVLAVIRP